MSFSGIIAKCNLFNRLNRNAASRVIRLFEMPIKKIVIFCEAFLFYDSAQKNLDLRNLQVWPTYCMPQSFSSQDKT